jgi:hypothetical protein
MSLQEFTRDVVPLLQLIVSALGLASLVLLWWQLRQTNLWNKLNSPQNFVNPVASIDLERKLYDSLKTLSIDIVNLYRSITQEELNKIIENDDAYFATKAYLNDLENLGVAISIGAADPDLTYAVHSARLIRAYEMFMPFIKVLRDRQSNPEIYIEIEKIALGWQRKQAARQEAQKKQIQKLEASLEKEKGAIRKV